MELYLIRNAEHVDYAARRWPVKDTPLSPLGIAQAGHLVERFRRVNISQIFTSTAQRCFSTIAPLAQSKSLAIQEAPEFNPFNMGDFNGLTHEESFARLPKDVWDEILSSPNPDGRYFSNCETLNEVVLRALPKIEEIVSKASDGEACVLCTNAGTIGCLLCSICGVPLSRVSWWGIRTRPPLYASITKINYDRGRWQLVAFGCLDYLPLEARTCVRHD